ncbi:MAG TPA: hypothetical protein VHN14_00980 [Kofleriaceae bacterium]|jgi:hypothetical protein|nr:hypothetical protein [Kofleriaceae bacterium]
MVRIVLGGCGDWLEGQRKLGTAVLITAAEHHIIASGWRASPGDRYAQAFGTGQVWRSAASSLLDPPSWTPALTIFLLPAPAWELVFALGTSAAST